MIKIQEIFAKPYYRIVNSVRKNLFKVNNQDRTPNQHYRAFLAFLAFLTMSFQGSQVTFNISQFLNLISSGDKYLEVFLNMRINSGQLFLHEFIFSTSLNWTLTKASFSSIYRQRFQKKLQGIESEPELIRNAFSFSLRVSFSKKTRKHFYKTYQG